MCWAMLKVSMAHREVMSYVGMARLYGGVWERVLRKQLQLNTFIIDCLALRNHGFLKISLQTNIHCVSHWI